MATCLNATQLPSWRLGKVSFRWGFSCPSFALARPAGPTRAAYPPMPSAGLIPSSFPANGRRAVTAWLFSYCKIIKLDQTIFLIILAALQVGAKSTIWRKRHKPVMLHHFCTLKADMLTLLPALQI